MERNEVKEAWKQIFLWYRKARGAHAQLNTEELDEVTLERGELYRCGTLEVLKVPLLVRKVDNKYSIPTEVEVAEAVRVLKGVRTGSPLGI